MDFVLELFVTFLAWLIYGSDEVPKHPIWRNSVRAIAFSGAIVFIFKILGLLGNMDVPVIISGLWILCFIIVLSAEYYIGSVKVAYAAIATFIVMSLALIVAWI